MIEEKIFQFLQLVTISKQKIYITDSFDDEPNLEERI